MSIVTLGKPKNLLPMAIGKTPYEKKRKLPPTKHSFPPFASDGVKGLQSADVVQNEIIQI